MVDAFKKYLSDIVSSGQLSAGDRQVPPAMQRSFLLAVSGGLDSVVMADLFRLSGYNYSIAHCNFQLRGNESDGDADFVKGIAEECNAPFFSVRFDTEKFCADNKVSVQMGARQLRYDWLEEIRRKNNLDYIVTAHHADDAIETFFINLLRGTGISGLHGIKKRHENSIRPLLNFYRKDIECFAKENMLKWREDSSNGTDKYERNKIRHQLLPVLEEISPRAKESITATIENISRTEEIYNKAIDNSTFKFIRIEGGRMFIHLNFFKELVPPVEYLYETIKKAGFNYEQCKQIAERINGQSGKIFWSDTHRIVIDRENLIIEPKVRNEETFTFEIEKELEELSAGSHKYFFKIVENTVDFKIPAEAEHAALDFDKLSFPLKIRKWQEGDRFYPLGMNKSKKVSNFLIDGKVSIPEKDRIHVLVSAENIVWIIGHRPDERFKVTKATKNIYLCSFQNVITS